MAQGWKLHKLCVPFKGKKSSSENKLLTGNATCNKIIFGQGQLIPNFFFSVLNYSCSDESDQSVNLVSQNSFLKAVQENSL